MNDDWQTAEVDARAWINWSLADEIRSDLDSFLEGICLLEVMAGCHRMRLRPWSQLPRTS